ncbi:MAG TPA: hypothetical protein VK445_11380 [Dissulfurispiraceae bacterium]|nr:hypothetical protein [Dissulfurispiraceae bacterium]
MERLHDFIQRHGLEETPEYVIISFVGRDGRRKRAFFLKRPYMRLVVGENRYADYRLEDVLEASIKAPEDSLIRTLASVLDRQPVTVRHGDELPPADDVSEATL